MNAVREFGEFARVKPAVCPNIDRDRAGRYDLVKIEQFAFGRFRPSRKMPAKPQLRKRLFHGTLGCLCHLHGGLRFAASDAGVNVLHAHDVILSEVSTRLNLDEVEWYLSRI